MARLDFDAGAAIKILEYVKDGLFPSEVAAAAGISGTRFDHWIAQAQKGLDDDAHNDPEHELYEVTVWLIQLTTAEAAITREAISGVRLRAKKGDVAASKFLLTHRGRSHWHQREAKSTVAEITVVPYVPAQTKIGK